MTAMLWHVFKADGARHVTKGKELLFSANHLHSNGERIQSSAARPERTQAKWSGFT